MRSIYALVAMASISTYAACPDLAGNYNCSGQGQTQQVKVGQKTDAGVTTYTVGSYSMVADGKARPFPSQDLRDATIVGSCDQNNNLNVQAQGKAYFGESYKGDLTIKMVFTKTSNTNVKWNQTQTFKPVGGGAGSTASTTLSCDKI